MPSREQTELKKQLIILLLLPFFLVGCSSTYVYNNLDWLLYWYLDDYVELNKTQKVDFDIKLESWLSWHRQQELIQYKNQLTDLKARFNAGPLSAQEWKNEFDKGRAHWERLRNRVGPELVEFAPVLTDEQVAFLFEELEDQNVEREEKRAEKSDEERRKERIEDAQDQMKSYIGKLTKAQKDLIAVYEDRFKSNFVNWIAYRRAIQAQAKELMQTRNTDPEFTSKLTTLMENPQSFQSQEYSDISAHNRNVSAEMIAELNLTFTAKQKKRINKKVDDLLEDLEDLIKD